MIKSNRNCGSLVSLLFLVLMAPFFLHAESPGTLEYTRYPQRFDDRFPVTPDQNLLLRFNQEVEAEKVADYFEFFNESKDESKKVRIIAQSRRPSIEEIKSFGKSLVREELTGESLVSAQNHFVLINPSQSLVQGYQWHLASKEGLTNFSKSHSLSKPAIQYLGTLNPFVIQSVAAVTPYDEAMTLYISHGKFQLAPEMEATRLAQSIEINPVPEAFRIEAENYGIRLHGKFEYDIAYDVVVKPGIVGNDKTVLSSEVKKSVTFHPNPGFIRLPVFSSTQSAGGHRSLDVEMANLKNIRSRVKTLVGDNLISTLKGYQEGYSGDGNKRTIPFSMVPGKTIFDQSRDRTAKYDTTESVPYNWSEINSQSEFGAYYVSVEGESDTAAGTNFGAHALVQVTDIGMAWKQTESETLIYAFSLKTGAPKNDLAIRLVNDEGGVIDSSNTNAEGIARFSVEKYKDTSLWLDASGGSDRHVMAFSKSLSRIGLWSFDIPTRHSEETGEERRTMIFTDRDVYKPGEKVYLKCITRTNDSDRLLPAKPCSAQFTMTDHQGRKLVDKKITFSANGTFHDEIALPELALGYHSITIDFNDPEIETESEYENISYHSINVAEYRVNTFEVAMDSKNVMTGDATTVPLSAKYYMGKPLSKALVNWNAYANQEFPDRDIFESFHFGDYYQESESYSSEGKLELGEGGQTNIDLTIPVDEKNPAPRQVFVRAEITDVNQQTISSSTSFTIHSSDFYIGLRKPEGVYRAGDEVPFHLANIDTDGKVYQQPVDTSITVEKEIWTTVKVKGADGKITHRNERQLEMKHQGKLHSQTGIDPNGSLPLSQAHTIPFAEAGDYIITLEAVDAKGRKIRTRDSFRIIGAEEPAWAWNDVVAIDLVPDRKSYRVGDTAKLLVRSPIFGKALVTTERGNVKSARVVEISKAETMIDVPIDDLASPNLFASVLIIRGAASSPHKHPTTDYRLGYCQIDIEDPGKELSVTLDNGGAKYVIPGETVEVSAMVKDAAGKGVAGAEVTLYAVDEGNLSLTNYKTPNLDEVFHAPFPLAVRLGQSLSGLLPENPLEREFGNKGFVIGGGGMSETPVSGMKKVRKNFIALAFWKPDLLTDGTGKVTHTFTAPDNLTSFRLIAVAVKGNTFGSADKPLVVNKPIIIEPALPSFSNLGDQIDLTAVLHNNTEVEQALELAVELDKHAIFIGELGTPLTTALPSKAPGDSSWKGSLTIRPGQTEVVHLPVGMIKNGEAKWQWKVQSKSDPSLVDNMESSLPIGFPLPLLKTHQNYTIKEAGPVANWLADVNPRLLDGTGIIEVSVSNSRIVDATDALEYLLEYPYGCVEQTTSTTIPWLSTANIRKALPALKLSDVEIDRAIKKGTSRLLSMQTSDGGLGYWPGAQESLLSGSAYGGLALVMAEKLGVQLPKDRLDHLWQYLGSQLRDSGKLTNPDQLSDRCLSLYTLALAGKSEPAYLDILFNKKDKLPAEARALLALAILEADTTDPRVGTLLTEKAGDAVSQFSWYQKPYLKATELMAWSKYRPGDTQTDQLLTDLMSLRRPGLGWGSTYSNAWPLMALAAHSAVASSSSGGNEVTLQFGDRIEKIQFDGSLSSQSYKFQFERDITGEPLKINVQNPGMIYASLKVSTQPKVLAMEPENQGFNIKRTYQKVELDGSLHPTDNLMVGDLVLVQIDCDIPKANEQYIAIDDPLPSILEAVNSSFVTQETRDVKLSKDDKEKVNFFYTNHQELRKDRTLFFADHVYAAGRQRIQYLTRVIAAGDSIAPPTKIEAMYQPERYGLSGTSQLSARELVLKDVKVVQR